jgi:hypothetical protein
VSDLSVSTSKNTVVKAHTSRKVPIKVKGTLPPNCDFRFTAHYNSSTAYLALHGLFPEAVIDHDTNSVIYDNNSDTAIRIRKNEKIGTVSDWNLNDRASRASQDVVDVMFGCSKIVPSVSTCFKFGLCALQCAQLFLTSQTLGTEFSPSPDTMLANPSTSIYSLLPPLDPIQRADSKLGAAAVNVNTKDNITSGQVKALRDVLEKFPTLWENKIGRVVEPEEDWLEIPFKPGAVIESKGRYRVSKRDEAVIDEVFDSARKDGRLLPSEGTNPAGWPVFVVWSKGRGRPVIDLRGLNAMVIPDAYPLPRQDNVIAKVLGKLWIALFDLQKAFYQRNVKWKDRWKLTVITHRGQEIFGVAPMGYIGSPAYMQKYMDKLLEIHKEYTKCFVDDTAVYSDDFESHLKHIAAVLTSMEQAGMTLSPEKCFVGYHSIDLLGHHVDRFGLSTLDKKVEAISKLEFPRSLRELDYFLGLTGWYRHFVARYAALVDPLQKLKTKLFKKAPRKGRERDSFSRSTKIIDPSVLEKAAFQEIKSALCDCKLIIIHPDPKLPLIFHVDSSAENGFASAVHQVPQQNMANMSVDDVLNGNYDCKLEKPVLYLSRTLSKHEHNYWPTELEIAGIVWSVQKTRHLIEGTNHVKICTDHKSAEDVLTSTTLKTSSAVRQNLRLIRASQFLSQYPHVRIIFRLGKDMVNADAISRLHRIQEDIAPAEDIYGFVVTVVGISTNVLKDIADGYTKDRQLAPIYTQLLKKSQHHDVPDDANSDAIVPMADIHNTPLSDETITYQGFHAKHCHGYLLMFMTDLVDEHHRLCILQSCHQNFFDAVHDQATHDGYHKCYQRLRPNYYIPNMSRLLKRYISECPTCAVNSASHHKPHSELKPIKSSLPFEFISVDFVVKLPESSFNGNIYDSFMSCTDLATKMVTLIPGRETHSAEDWARAFFYTYCRR